MHTVTFSLWTSLECSDCPRATTWPSGCDAIDPEKYKDMARQGKEITGRQNCPLPLMSPVQTETCVCFVYIHRTYLRITYTLCMYLESKYWPSEYSALTPFSSRKHIVCTLRVPYFYSTSWFSPA